MSLFRRYGHIAAQPQPQPQPPQPQPQTTLTPVAWVARNRHGSVYHLSVEDGWQVDTVAWREEPAA